MSTSPYRPEDEQRLINRLLSPEIADNPFLFVKFAFPWGVAGTPLARYQGPRTWQIDELLAIGEHIEANRQRMARGLDPQVYQSSTVSGRGIGKSALVSWLNLWSRSCLIGSTAITTANTEAQLISRTWAELGKWHTLSINRHWFDKTATALRPEKWFADLVQSDLQIDTGYYYAQAQLWSEENPDAFAGVHNPLGLILIMDEASGIPAPIWKVSDGFFTEPVLHRYWLVFSNGRRNTGAFYETHHKHRDLWKCRQIDARTVEGTDPAVYDKIITQYGADSDEARVEVYGQFPSSGANQFIGRELVQAAQVRELAPDPGAALVIGVDVARFGDDHSVIFFRQGRDARSRKPLKFKGLTTIQLAGRVAEQVDRVKPDAVFVDGGGVGGGVVDALRSMGYKVIDVQSGAKADEPERYANRRAELWGKMRDWLATGCLADDPALADDLTGPEYDHALNGAVKLEPKDKMKQRGLASPDCADALALTFDRRIARRDANATGRRAPRVAKDVDYSLFS
ncbi:terminase [Pannonibacter tanglangensis]|uniref:Terminase n=1 Tax=Pannonibacter tanglangensis TaxID=2750084 RepID=A0ABW9ZBP5_9HYPH|nr:terminase [Pannonibacter sp. XCT-34]NBN62058.1 terminase [Pannonibacter sp. XCT-34]